MLSSRGDHSFASVLEQVVEEEKGLVDSPPVLLVILQQPFPQHAHRFRESLVGECEGGDFLHLGSARTPGVVICCLANLFGRMQYFLVLFMSIKKHYLRLSFCIVHNNIGGLVHKLSNLE